MKAFTVWRSLNRGEAMERSIGIKGRRTALSRLTVPLLSRPQRQEQGRRTGLKKRGVWD
ncbi:MAG: hypothetical protein RBJ76_03440 [Stenomitos frigidus ULC029]